MSDASARELRAETTIAATPAQVWTVLTDFSRMPDWSPELVTMKALKPGGLKVGQQYLGVNRRKAIAWPSRSVVAVVEPERVLAWDTRSSGARWIYELSADGAGTRVVQRRPVPKKLTALGKVFATAFLGGTDGHCDELEAGMASTLTRLKAAVEG
jgi:uncharacterized protein YndB with AHSA1/START domain